jgi:hypothetical protein
MAFAEGWEDIEKYGNAKEAWLRKSSRYKTAFPNMTCTAGSLPG